LIQRSPASLRVRRDVLGGEAVAGLLMSRRIAGDCAGAGEAARSNAKERRMVREKLEPRKARKTRKRNL
jgi:hypothetical protein